LAREEVGDEHPDRFGKCCGLIWIASVQFDAGGTRFTGHSLFVWLVADGWCWFVLREKYCWLVAGG
jgi:hypothetical protein